MRDSRRYNARHVRIPRTFTAFADRDYRFLWPSNLLSYTARWMQITLLSWFVLSQTDSPWLVALVGFFGTVPMLLLGLLGGVLADMPNRRRVMIATQAANFVVSVAMAAALLMDLALFWHAYPVALVSGIGWALDMPSRRSIMHDLLGRTGLTNAVALDSVGMSASAMLGPALAGALILLVGVSGGYVAVSATYLAATALLSQMRLSRVQGARRGQVHLMQDLAAGLRYVAGHSTLRATVTITLLMNLLLFPYMHLMPVMARDVLHVGPGLMGVLQAVSGLGALFGAIVVASAMNIRYHGRVFMGGSMLALTALLLFSLSEWYWLSGAILVILGVGTAGFSTMQSTLVMLLSREEMRGKALGVVGLAIGAGPLGALLFGGLAHAAGPAAAMTMLSVLGAVCLLVIAILMPSLRGRILPAGGQPELGPQPQPPHG